MSNTNSAPASSLLQKLDTAALGAAYRNAKPFPSICIDGLLDPAFVLEVAKSYPSWAEAERAGFAFDATNERRKIQITDPAKFPPPVHRLAEVLSSAEFRAMLSEITGIPNLLWDDRFEGGGMHQTAARGRLDVHVDFNRLESQGWYRRVNLLLYLNEDWLDSWGGRIELWDSDVQRCWHSFAPILNRCVIFSTSEISYHGVTPLSCPSDLVRRSFALYYYTKEPPADAGSVSHSTIFRARPNEYVRRHVLMPADRVGQKLREAARRVKRNVRDALRRLG